MIGSPPATGERCFDGTALAVRPSLRAGSDRLRLAVGAGVGLLGRLGGRLLHVAGHIVVARVLGAEAFGLYAIGWTVLRFGSLLAPLGLQHGVTRFGSLHWERDTAGLKGVVLQSLGLTALGGSIAALLLYAGAPLLAERVFGAPELLAVLRGFAPAVVAAALLRVAASASRISQRAHWGVLSEDLTQGLTQLLFIVGFLGLGWGVAGAVAAAGLSLWFALAVALLCLVPALPALRDSRRPRPEPYAALLQFSAVASFAGFATIVLPWADRLVVAVFRPPVDVGIYQAASQISILFAMILGAFGAIFAPMISRLHRDGDSARLRDLYATSTKWALYLGAPAFLVVFFAGDRLLVVLFGVEFSRGATVLSLLALGQLANVATGVVGLMLIMTGHQRPWFAVTAVALLINVSLNVMLIPRFGLEGAAVATALSLAGLFLSGLALVRRKLHCWPYDRRYLRGLTALLPTLLLLWSWSRVDVEPWIGLLVTGLVAVGGFYGLLGLFGLEAEDRELVDALRRRLGLRVAP